MNKKKLSLIIICVCVALVLVVSIILATAGGNPETPETTTSTEASEGVTTGENNAQDPTTPGENTAPGESKEPAAAAAATTPDAEEETQPATIPPENVQMGVEEDPDLNPDIEDTPDQPTQPTQPNPGTETPAVQEEGLPEDFDITTLTYESYNAMNGTQQRQAIAMFASPEEFMKWYKAVEAQYLAEHPEIEIGEDGTIDAGSIGK